MTITIKFYIEAAKARGWTYEWIDEYRNVISIQPPDEDPIIIRNNMTELGTAIGYVTANLKSVSTTLAEKAGFIVPQTIVVEATDSTEKAVSLLNKTKRVVVKPMDGAFGDGISTNVTSVDMLGPAIDKARANNVKSEAVVIQEFCEGRDYRLFILDGKLVAAIERVPLLVVGDGTHTLEELLDSKMAQIAHREDNKVKAAVIDKTDILAQLHGHQAHQVVPEGECIIAQGVANLSKGGEAVDVTDIVFDGLVQQAVTLAKLIRLDMCAVDVLSEDISKDPQESHTKFIEINVAPGFRGHYYPTVGRPRELAPLILDTILRKRQQQKDLQKTQNNV